MEGNDSLFGFGVFDNVVELFLHDTENGKLQVAGEFVLVHFVPLDADTEIIHLADMCGQFFERRLQSFVIQRRGEQCFGEFAYLSHGIVEQGFTFRYQVGPGFFILQGTFEVELGGGKYLVDVVMQFLAQLQAFFFLPVDHRPGDLLMADLPFFIEAVLKFDLFGDIAGNGEQCGDFV